MLSVFLRFRFYQSIVYVDAAKIDGGIEVGWLRVSYGLLKSAVYIKINK